MDNEFHLDYETYSRAPIKKVGGFRYSDDPSTQILLCAIARGKEPPVIWDAFASSKENLPALGVLSQLSFCANVVYAHNAPFEVAISQALFRKTFEADPPAIGQWRCTQAMARRAALPQSLGELGEVLSLAVQKDKRGEQLIKIFCQPQTVGKRKGQRILPTDEGVVTLAGEKVAIAEAWKLFRRYCIQDVKTEREIHKVLAPFELRGRTLKSFHFDMRMNLRGLPVNVAALENANKTVNEAGAAEIKRFRALTGINPSQTGKLLAWLRERGYNAADLQEATMTGVIDVPPPALKPEALEALQIRARVSFASVKKIPAMLAIACRDDRVKGSLSWSGAVRTHRWSGRLIQPQNFKRPVKHLAKKTPDIYAAICDGWDHEMISMVWGNPIEATASSIRHFIQEPDCDMLDADYRNIEARITPWLAGQDDLLQAFRDGRDCYVEMASHIFSKPELEVTEGERFVGKQAVLGCGFQCGWEKFQVMCANYGRHLEDDICKLTVETYREKNDKIASLWKVMQRAAVDAIKNPGHKFVVRGKVTFSMAGSFPFPALLARLPSGHCLVYPWPKLKTIWIFDKRKFRSKELAEAAANVWKRQRVALLKAGKLTEEEAAEDEPRVWSSQQISFMGPDPITKKWGERSTYGGSLTENMVQAVAGDFISYGALKAEEAGYSITFLVHDQALAQYRPEKGNTADGFKEALCTLPAWAGDFPLDAEVKITPYYTK